jgi:predicted transport protein
MSFQAYLDTVKAKTGKTPADFAKLAAEQGLTKHGEIVTWLKSDFALGHGHANAIAAVLLKSEAQSSSTDDKVAKVFSGQKAAWRSAFDALVTKLETLGEDIQLAPTETYVSLLRGDKKIGIVQPSKERLDIGIKLKGVEPTARLEVAGSWNSMVTHRVRLADSSQIDGELLKWLKQAYEDAKPSQTRGKSQ